MGECMGPRVGLHAVEKRKISWVREHDTKFEIKATAERRGGAGEVWSRGEDVTRRGLHQIHWAFC
jgi:hypothetical protein